jgi:hypothetical protein
MTDAAIQQDVEKQEPVAVSARNDAMAAIAERARQERDQEIVESGGTVVDTLNVDENKEEKPKVAAPEENNESAVLEQEEQKPETVKIKVDGEEREVPKDKILDAGIRALQKESTADKRLEEATRLLRDIEQKYAQPAQQQQQQSLSQEWDDATVAYALEHGSEEQKAYAVSLMRGRGNATQEALEAIEQRAVTKALDTVDFRDASQWFQSEYKDIVADPYLLQLAGIAEDKARASGDQRSRRELYKSIGDDLRTWKGGVTTTQSLEQKRDQKSNNIINLPSASVRKSAPAEAKPKSTSDIIEEMRRKRGQR